MYITPRGEWLENVVPGGRDMAMCRISSMRRHGCMAVSSSWS